MASDAGRAAIIAMSLVHKQDRHRGCGLVPSSYRPEDFALDGRAMVSHIQKSSPEKAPLGRTVDLVINTSGIGGKGSVSLKGIPVPILFNDLAQRLTARGEGPMPVFTHPEAHLNALGLPVPALFATQSPPVSLRVVNGPSTFDAVNMSGDINM